MSGTKSSGRPGGNPELEKYQYEQIYNWDEPCTAKMTLRMPPSLYEKLREIENWQEFTRVAIAKAIEEENS